MQYRRATDQRKRDLADIHVAKAKLGLTEDEYRDLMATVCAGVRSSASLDIAGRQRFLEHLRSCLRARGLAAGKPARARSALTPYQRKVWALWMQLADAGLVHDRKMVAIETWARRHTGVDRIAFLNPQQQQLVVESLKLWLKRRREEPVEAAR